MAEEKNLKWKGKFLRINWSDGTHDDFPAKSLVHYVALRRFALGRDQK